MAPLAGTNPVQETVKVLWPALVTRTPSGDWARAGAAKAAKRASAAGRRARRRPFPSRRGALVTTCH